MRLITEEKDDFMKCMLLHPKKGYLSVFDNAVNY